MKLKLKKYIKKVKLFYLNLKKYFLKVWKNNPLKILIPLISGLIFIICLFFLSLINSIIVFMVINLIYFIPLFIIKRKKESDVMKAKKKKSSKKRKINFKKVFKIFLLTMLILFILGVIGVVSFCAYIVINAPEFDEDLLYVTNPSIILDKDNNEIMKLGEEKRVVLEYDEIPEVLIDAIIATEDSRFFEHTGVDWARFLKASFLQLLGKSEAGGASTLTMQVSKNTYTSKEASGIEGIIRKFTDVYVSMFKIEKNYTKEQIMEFYVNTYWLGSNSYGVEQISKTYFGKSAKDLNLAEAAMIAGLFQAPGSYNPYKYGFSFTYSEQGNIFQCLGRSVTYNVSLVKSVINSLKWLITGRLGMDALSGPIGLTSVVSDVVDADIGIGYQILTLINLMALISANLGAFNLLPIPGLDGGKLVFVVVELIRGGKKVPPEKEAIVSLIFMALLVILSLFVAGSDIFKLIG